MVKNPPKLPAPPEVKSPHQHVLLFAALLVAATFAAYANTLHAPWEYDDLPSILDNPTIRHLWPLSLPLSPPSAYGVSVGGRPLLNLSLALNYAVSGTDPWSYHVVNLAIHAAAALALFGLVRRTLLAPVLREKFSAHATFIATTTAAIWALHPLQTESVTYVIQRAESLMGLFYFLTFYAFVRSAESNLIGYSSFDPSTLNPHSQPSTSPPLSASGPSTLNSQPSTPLWPALVVLSALCAMASKEVAVTAPVLLFLFDRTFIAGSFRAAWRARRGLHLAVAATWLLLAWLVVRTGDRGGTFNFTDSHAWTSYWLTQPLAVAHYLRLALWPHPLVFDYGTIRVENLSSLLVPATVVLAFVFATLLSLRRRPVGGFLGAWFLLILAPTSLLPGVMQQIAEHRLYLSLAAVAVIVALLIAQLPARARVPVTATLAVLLGSLTFARNHTYRSPLALWSDTLAKAPANARALNNVGQAVYLEGRYDEALRFFTDSLARDPASPLAHFNLGLVLGKLGRPADAAREFAEAGRLQPGFAHALLQQALVSAATGDGANALSALERAVQLRPDLAEAQCNLGILLLTAGRPAEAQPHLEQALRARPDYPEAEANLGLTLQARGDLASAVAHFRRALALKPDLPLTHFNLALAYASLGNALDALAAYRDALRVNPAHADAHLNLGILLAQSGDPAAALPEIERATQLAPDFAEAHNNLGIVLADLGRPTDALAHYETALRLKPAYPQAHYNLANTLLSLRRLPEARAHLEQALQSDPRFAPARDLLARLPATP